MTDIVLEHWGDPKAAATTVVRTALTSGSGDNLTAQVVAFGWKHERALEVQKARAKQKVEEAAKAAEEARKPKPVVEEDDVDMFS